MRADANHAIGRSSGRRPSTEVRAASLDAAPVAVCLVAWTVTMLTTALVLALL